MSLSSSSPSNGCGPFEFDPHGRDGIGVVQQQSGTNYPLVLPSEDVRYLLADFYMSFDQPSDYDSSAPVYKPPFYIYWMGGIGCIEVDRPETYYYANSVSSEAILYATPLGYVYVWGEPTPVNSSSSSLVPSYQPIPNNEHDIVIIDSNGLIVFDSTTILNIAYSSRDWGSRLHVVTWQHPTDAYVSLVYHTKWQPNGTPTPINYPDYFFPQFAQLDERAVERLPKRVRSLTAVFDNFRETGIEFINGYNMNLSLDSTSEIVGKRRSTRLTFDATPGAGLGIFTGCDPEPLVIRTINSTGPNKHGQFYLTAKDCLYARQPTVLLSTTPRVTIPATEIVPGSTPTAGLPSPLAGTVKNLPGWPTNDNPLLAHLQIGSDCDACCDCDDYISAAKYLNRTRDSYQDIGQNAYQLSKIYHDNRERWLTEGLCIASKPLRIRLLPQICPFLDVAVQYCNQTDDCKLNVELQVNFTNSPVGPAQLATIVPGFTYIKGATRNPGRTSGRLERYVMGGSEYPGPITCFFEDVPPRQSVTARFRLVFKDCGLSGDTPYAITGCVTATIQGQSLTIREWPNGPLVPARACDTRTLDCPVGPGSVWDPLTCIECTLEPL